MLRRKSPASYKHMLLSDSDTESDDDVVVVGVRKKNGKGIMVVDKDVGRKKFTSVEKEFAKAFKSNSCLDHRATILSRRDTESDDDVVVVGVRKKNEKGIMVDKDVQRKKFTSAEKEFAKAFKSNACLDRRRGDLVELAKEYQRRMKQVPIPKGRALYGAVFTWHGMAKSLRNLYGQPLHYLTFMLCKQWDQSRFGSEDGHKPLDAILKWNNVESTIWKVEENHRLCTSPLYLAMLWQNDPEYRTFVDEVIPPPSCSLPFSSYSCKRV